MLSCRPSEFLTSKTSFAEIVKSEVSLNETNLNSSIRNYDLSACDNSSGLEINDFSTKSK